MGFRRLFRVAFSRRLVNNKLSPRMSRVPRPRPSWRTSAFLSYIERPCKRVSRLYRNFVVCLRVIAKILYTPIRNTAKSYILVSYFCRRVPPREIHFGRLGKEKGRKKKSRGHRQKLCLHRMCTIFFDSTRRARRGNRFRAISAFVLRYLCASSFRFESVDIAFNQISQVIDDVVNITRSKDAPRSPPFAHVRLLYLLHVSSFYYSWRGSNEPIVQVGKKDYPKGEGKKRHFPSQRATNKKRWGIGFSFFFSSIAKRSSK